MNDMTKATPRIRSLLTPSGIEIWHVEDYTVPVVSLEFAFLGGAAQDEPGKAGLANLVSGLLDEGAGELDSAAFQEALEDKAIELSFDGGRDRLDGSLRTLAENTAEAFRLLTLTINAPRFDAEAIERVRAQIISGLKRDESDPSALARDALNRLAFSGHVYGQSVEGSITDLGAITRQEIVAQHARLFARHNLRVVAVGAIGETALVTGVEQAFGALPQFPQLRPVTDIVPGNGGHREIIDLDIPQSTLLLAMPGIARKDPAFMSAMVLNHILGGGSFTSRLWNEVREKRGLAYSVWSTLSNREHASLFLAGTATSNERVAESLGVILGEIAAIGKTNASAAELAQAKNYLTGSYALRFDTSRKIAHQLLEIQIDGLGIDYIDRRNDEVQAVTLEAMEAVSARLFAAPKPLVVAAGRPVGL
ncbi:MAG: insulinase family protein [Proteobacteria bacterium]|nr:insulinase family protein [Pseudomonadota bacterium]